MKMEQVSYKFYQGLEEGKIYARKCKECGAIEFPPRYGCNTCGYHETEWTEISGKGTIESCVPHGIMNSRPYLDEVSGKYAFCGIKLDEGPELNGVVFGIGKKKAAAIKEKIRNGEAVRVKPRITQREGYKTLYFELDED